MATVIGKTSVRIDNLLGPLLIDAEITTARRLVITTKDGTVRDLGPVGLGQTDLDPINAELSNLAGEVANNEIVLDGLNDDLSNLNQVILPGFQAELDAAELAINTLNNTSLPQLQADLEANDAAVNNLSTTIIPALQADLDAAEAEVVDLTATVIPGLQADLTSANTAINNLSGDVNSVEADLNTLNTTTLPNLQDDLVTANELIISRVQLKYQGTQPSPVTSEDRVLWYNTSDGYKASYWDGVSWAPYSLGEAALADGAITSAKLVDGAVTGVKITDNAISAEKIAANAVTAEKIVANAITANKLNVVMGGENLFLNSSFEDDTANPMVSGSNGTLNITSEAAYRGAKSLKLTAIASGDITIQSGGYNQPTRLVPVQMGKIYTITGWFLSPMASRNVQIDYAFSNGTALVGVYTAGTPTLSSTTEWVRPKVTTVTVPPGATHLRLIPRVAGGTTGSIPAGEVHYLDAVKVEEGDVPTAYSPNTAEILPGTIDAAMIQADAITAEKIRAGNITTDHMTAGTINGDRVTANTLNADKIIAGSITSDRMTANTINGDRITSNTLHADKIVANTITGDKIMANSISTTKLLIGSFDNLVGDPNFTQPYGTTWVTGSGNLFDIDPTGSRTGGRVLRIVNDGGNHFTTNDGGAFKVEPGASYRLAVTTKSSAGIAASALWLGLRWEAADGSFTANYVYSDSAHLANVWTTWGGILTAPAGTVSAKMFVQTFDAGLNGVTTRWEYPSVTRAASGSLIVDGAITSNHITVNTLSGDRITANTLNATKIVSGSITSDRMTANTINGDRITANTLNATKIVAGSITSDRMTANTINGDRITANTLNADRIVAGSITSDRITANTLNADRLVAGSITTDRMTANTINGDRVTANTLHADKIIANSITAAKIAAGAITANKLAISDPNNYAIDFNLAANRDQYPSQGAGGWNWNYAPSDLTGVWRLQSVSLPGNLNVHFPLSDMFQVKGTDEFYIEFEYYSETAVNYNTLIGLRSYNDMNSVVQWLSNGSSAVQISPSAADNAWVKITGSIKPHVSASRALIEVQSVAFPTPAGSVYIRNLVVRRKNGGSLIVDGAIDGKTITGATITGGTFRTAASGERLEMSTTTGSYVGMYTGAAVEYGGPGAIIADHVSNASEDHLLMYIFPPRTSYNTYSGGTPGISLSEIRNKTSGVSTTRATLTASSIGLYGAVGFGTNPVSLTNNAGIYTYSNAVAIYSGVVDRMCIVNGDGINSVNGAFNYGYAVYGSAFINNSDIAFKSNLKKVTSAVDTLKALPVYDYDTMHGHVVDKEGKIKKNHTRGIIAQDLQKVAPHLVVTPTDPKNKTGIGVDIYGVLATTMAALQEMIDRVEVLETSLAATRKDYE